MSPPIAEAIDLTHAMLSAAKAGDWPHFGRLHEQRTRLLKPGLYVHADAPRLLPRLDAAQKELAATLGDDTAALDETSELLRPIRDAAGELPNALGQALADDLP
ncbi:MAG: hypothetical protein ACREPZ_00115 [Rhodanobacteraceae bacterium]